MSIVDLLDKEAEKGKIVFVGEIPRDKSLTREVEQITKKPVSSYSALFMLPAQKNESGLYFTNRVYAILK